MFSWFILADGDCVGLDDVSGRLVYLFQCQQFGIVPVSQVENSLASSCQTPERDIIS